MMRIMLASLAAAALLSMATGGEAFGQSVKKDKRPLPTLQEYAIHGKTFKNKPKVPAGSLTAGQRKQRVYPAAGCPQCTIKKD